MVAVRPVGQFGLGELEKISREAASTTNDVTKMIYERACRPMAGNLYFSVLLSPPLL